MRKIIGKITISYNRNTNRLYSTFEPLIKYVTTQPLPVEKIKLCEKEIAEKEVKSLLGGWFSEIESIEDSDIAENPIKQEIVDTRYFEDGIFKFQEILVYQELIEEMIKEGD